MLNSEEVKKSVLDGLRVAVISMVAIILMGIDTQTGSVDINWQMVKVAGTISLLKSLDKWLHESGVAEKGITRF